MPFVNQANGFLIGNYEAGTAYKTALEFKTDITVNLYLPGIHFTVGPGKIICP